MSHNTHQQTTSLFKLKPIATRRSYSYAVTVCIVIALLFAAPATQAQPHVHGDRSHTHGLPTQGIGHKHGNGPAGHTSKKTSVEKETRKISDFSKTQMAAKKGNVTAQHSLGIMYLKGWGIRKDPVMAFNWVSKAAQKGFAKSQFVLGDFYVDGVGVKAKSYQLAMRWYRRAADQGYPRAEYSVGAMYGNGNGVTRDLNQARYWFNRAAKQGLPLAKNALIKLNQMVND